jgi:hypothetical protein
VYTENEGMFNWECRRNSITKINDEAILIGTTNGPYIYYPHKDNTASLAKAYLSAYSFMCEGKDENMEIPVSSNMQNVVVNKKIPYSFNNIKIGLNGVSQRAPDIVVYHYRLNGLDTSWRSTNENKPLEFRSLQPGAYILQAYISVKDFKSPMLSISFTVKKPLQGELWFQLLVLAGVAVFIFFLLNVLNRLYQQYIQTRMVDELGKSMKKKTQDMNAALLSAQQHFKEVHKSVKIQHANLQPELAFVYVNAEIKRLQMLVANESISMKQFHEYFDEMLCSGKDEKKIYHEITDPSLALPMDKAFSLMEIFCQFMVWKLTENPQFLFSLNSDVRSNNRLVIRSYNLNALRSVSESALEGTFRKTLKRLQGEHWSIELIENRETSSMLIVEMET